MSSPSVIFSVLALATIAAVLLSAAGIYSLVSFTVSQRTREIGIRTALGARPLRIIAAILSRVLAQIGLGVVGGGLIVALAAVFGSERSLSGESVIVFLTAAAGMMLVALLACALPARRALRVEPTEALRDG